MLASSHKLGYCTVVNAYKLSEHLLEELASRSRQLFFTSRNNAVVDQGKWGVDISPLEVCNAIDVDVGLVLLLLFAGSPSPNVLNAKAAVNVTALGEEHAFGQSPLHVCEV